jgi:hypothetical protein
MNLRKRLTLNIILNIFLLVLIITSTYSWMLTQRSTAQLVDYNRNLIITDSDITVTAYAFINNQYVLQETSPMFLELLEPGAAQKYRFDITNNQSVLATTKAVMSRITGDVLDLQDFIYIGGTSPSVFYFPMSEGLMYNSVNDIYYMDIIDRIEIPGNSTVSVYIYVEMSEDAENDLQDKELYINRFMFIKA